MVPEPIVFTHAVVTTSKSKASIAKTGHIALIHVCSGPGDENSIAVLYGNLPTSRDIPPGIITPLINTKEGILPATDTLTSVLRGSILSKVLAFADFALDSIRKSHKTLKTNKKYRVYASGLVELVE